MNTKLLFNVSSHEIRVAILENNKLAEIFIQNKTEKSYVGNIYKGKVTRVLPGMQAAFVDIGLERAAFLYVTEFFDEYGDSFHPREVAEEKKRRKRGKVQIQDLLKEGQDVVVQVAKDPIGTKGARLTSHVSLPGRHLVYMPTVAHTGVSRKIADEDERRRLREIVRETQKMEGGFIIRTAADKQPANNIIRDIEHLEFQWKKIMDTMDQVKAPSIIHEDLDLVLRAVRDFFTEEIEELIVDDHECYRKIKQFTTTGLPKGRRKITHHEGPDTLFNTFEIDKQIDRALGRRVWLKSGGYLIFDHAEALTAIDVNTGRFVGKKSRSLEDTILQTNLEAVKEIGTQLRLRNIGGLIILDFIDMERKSSRIKVFQALEKELENDKAKTNVLKMSDLGLIEMTRKRTRENLTQQLCDVCEYCDGKGFHKSARTMAYAIMRKVLQEIHLDSSSHHNIEIVAHHKVASILKNEEYKAFLEFEKKTGRRVVIREQATFHPENFQINLTGRGESKAIVQSMPSEVKQVETSEEE
ncbi:MAG: Rne/Rng family ribonuclease [Bdellovibrionales bacterium]|nr:Rne/Rng family ribonuclease [Bdellovibrionales bacterium]